MGTRQTRPTNGTPQQASNMATKTLKTTMNKSAPAVAKKAAPPAPTELNAKQTKKRISKAQKGAITMRKQLWPDVTDDMLWIRHDKSGFTTIPRTMPLFMEIINDASKQVTKGSKSVPAGKAYLVLWCRVFDEAIVKIEADAAAAMEAGYDGERNVSTWREHLRVLKELGFIDYAGGSAGPCQYVLLLNPYHAAKKLNEKGWVQRLNYTALFQRAVDIGADDLDEEAKEDETFL